MYQQNISSVSAGGGLTDLRSVVNKMSLMGGSGQCLAKYLFQAVSLEKFSA